MTDPARIRASAEPITAVVADRVRVLRESQRMSQTDLADAMTRLGVPWKRTTVVNLEKRGVDSRGSAATGRDAVTVGELLGLALVLGVPPALLIADPRAGGAVPVADGVTMSADAALEWLTGLRPVDGTRPEDAELMRRWFAAKHAFEQWEGFHRVRLQLQAGADDAERAELDGTKHRLRAAYVAAMDDLARLLPEENPVDRGQTLSLLPGELPGQDA